jgi:hypothetical protein
MNFGDGTIAPDPKTVPPVCPAWALLAAATPIGYRPRRDRLAGSSTAGCAPVNSSGNRTMIRTASCLIAALALGLSACANPYDPAQNALGGGLLGAGTGAAIGAAAAGGPGAALGAAVGGAVGLVGGAASTPPPPGYYGYYGAPPPAYGYPGYGPPAYGPPAWGPPGYGYPAYGYPGG